VEAIKDAFTTMQEDLDAERRVITKQHEVLTEPLRRSSGQTGRPPTRTVQAVCTALPACCPA
jgi:hypothetical protein